MWSVTRLFVVAALVPIVGCAPSVHFKVLRPSPVTVPAHVKTIAFVDRSKAKNTGQAVLGILEGVLTGEALGGDDAGRREARRGLVEVLENSPRFNVVSAANIHSESNLFDKELRWPVARKICATLGCEGIVALEAFDSDSFVEITHEKYTDTVDGKQVSKVRHIAQRETTVHVAWRLYDTIDRVVVDDKRDHKERNSWRKTGPTPDAARAALPSQVHTIENVAYGSGKKYGARIAPIYISVSRTYYGGNKSDRLKSAKSYVKVGEWEEARKIWQEIVDTETDGPLKAMALHNIAVYHEVHGELKKALVVIGKAQKVSPMSGIFSYQQTLDRRRQDQKKLNKQMKGAD